MRSIYNKVDGRDLAVDGTKLDGLATESVSFSLETGVNKTIVLDSSATYARDIVRLKNLKTASGTITAAIQIGGTNVTSLSSLSVTSTPQSPDATGANSVAVGDRITLVLSSNSSAADIEFTMEYIRT